MTPRAFLVDRLTGPGTAKAMPSPHSSLEGGVELAAVDNDRGVTMHYPVTGEALNAGVESLL